MIMDGIYNVYMVYLFYNIWLVVWNMAFMTFHMLGMSSFQLAFIFFRGVGIPPARNC